MDRSDSPQDGNATPPSPEAPTLPNGNTPAKLDGGRLKLPPPYMKYLEGFGDKTVFVTTIDEATVRVYPRSKWKQAANWLQNPDFDPAAAERLWTRVTYYGADCVPDEQGRMQLPLQLRQDLKLDKVTVYLCPQPSGDRFDLVPQEIFDRELETARQHKAADVALAKKLRMP